MGYWRLADFGDGRGPVPYAVGVSRIVERRAVEVVEEDDGRMVIYPAAIEIVVDPPMDGLPYMTDDDLAAWRAA